LFYHPALLNYLKVRLHNSDINQARNMLEKDCSLKNPTLKLWCISIYLL